MVLDTAAGEPDLKASCGAWLKFEIADGEPALRSCDFRALAIRAAIYDGDVDDLSVMYRGTGISITARLLVGVHAG